MRKVQLLRMLQFTQRSDLLLYYSYTEKKFQELSAWVSCRAFYYNGLLSVIVLVAKAHFGLLRKFT